MGEGLRRRVGAGADQGGALAANAVQSLIGGLGNREITAGTDLHYLRELPVTGQELKRAIRELWSLLHGG